MSAAINEVVLIVLAGTFLMLLLLTFIISFFFLHQRRQTQNLREKATLHAQYQQEILQSQLEIQNQTLQHISEELHDNIGQLLSVARLHLNMLEEEETATPAQIREVNSVIDKTIQELRSLSKSLDGDFVKDFGLMESLSHELQRIRATGKYQTEIVTEGEPYRPEGQKEIVLFRVVQEILNNAIKHAAAKTITVTLRYEPAQFTLTIQDDGKGFDLDTVIGREMSQSGAGLRNIKRRTELVGGSCQMESTPGHGTKVTLQLPILTQIP
ncbi:sensor histidine kinase [Runella slithyformis]|uniref:Oxygen sensor histidine kinase NreB n=1 Tax=Runella slithyformis (strain ATCC 29530 / DSM 19594 / LMG 11500 / NCIMB 11436 / LSU 4) TaxID=761193 RepID=A0A7U3ZLA4_RUNSL|nr:ATP-binding protein [Runella slithyformis]AEI49252.1 putative signal transduction histidine kinase [Runella slithyformis DSM 19594]